MKIVLPSLHTRRKQGKGGKGDPPFPQHCSCLRLRKQAALQWRRRERRKELPCPFRVAEGLPLAVGRLGTRGRQGLTTAAAAAPAAAGLPPSIQALTHAAI